MNTETTSLNLEPGARLAGVYLLQNVLETGGSPAVWLAEDEVLGKSVALHFLPSAVAVDEQALAEIRLEVKRTRPLIHPSILRVFDLVEGEGWAAIATEAFVGRRLTTVLAERGRYEVRELDDWLDQICVALEEAHRIKLTHRDIAAENIFVKPDGRLTLANFGIGRAIQNSLLRAGELEGDAARFSNTAPQQLEPGAPSPTDDVYGLGALFYHLITGERIFAGDDVMTEIRDAVPPRLSDARLAAHDRGEKIPDGWDNVIAACLNKSRDERPGSPADVVSSIEAYAPPLAVFPEPVEVPEESPKVEPMAEKQPEQEAEAEAIVPSDFSDAEEIATPSAEIYETVEVAGEPGDIPEFKVDVEAKPEPDPEPQPAAVEAQEVIPETPAVASGLLAAAEVEATSAGTSEAPVATEVDVAPSSSPAPERPVVTRPLYDTEEDAFSSILPKRFRLPAAVAAAVVFVLFLINGAFKSKPEQTPSARPSMASDTADRSQLTKVKNTGRELPPQTPEETPVVAPSSPIEPPVPAAVAKAPAQPEMLVAAAPAAKAPGASAPAATFGVGGVDKHIAEKSAELDKLKADLAAAEKQEEAQQREKQAAEAAAVVAQKAIDAKTQAAAAAKKETQELIAARKQREDEQKAAELAAQAAQQLAAEKLRAAEDAKKNFADFESKNRTKLAAQDKIDAELQTLQRALEDHRKAAAESARAATDAATMRQQRRAAIDQAEQDLANARATAAKAAEETQRRTVVDSERKKLDDEISAMRALFEQKMKDIEDRRRQLEGAPTAPAAAPVPAAATVPEIRRPVAMATPVPGLPLMASRTEPVAAPLVPPAPTTLSAPAVAGPGTNSLGQRFVPVGDVQFATWLTRWRDFDAFARAVNLKSTAWRGPGFRQGPDHPVVNVTWNEAVAFCKWLTEKERKEGSLPANQFYRLPYDLEWSKAVGLQPESGRTPEARDMGVPDVYPWGTDWPPPKGAGNYTGEETGSDVAIKGYDDGFAWTSPVGSFPANQLGIHDMGGNVWQWCMDSWNADSKARVLRGASWYNGALKLSLLASCRVHAAPDSSTDNYGFRIVRATDAGAAKSNRR